MSQSLTDVGWRVDSTPVYELTVGANAGAIGEAVLESIKHFKENVPHLIDVPEADDPVLRSIGVASWESLSSRHANLCWVESDGAQITVTSTIGDENGGYTPEPATQRRCEMTAGAVGEAVLSAFGSPPRCE